MELEKQIIKMNRERGRAFSQITLEDDYIVPDSKPDVIKIIHTQGNLVFDEPRINNQALWINGRMNFTVLYRSEDEMWKLETVSGTIPFQEKLSLDNLEEQDNIRLRGSFEDISAAIINSRKLAIRAVMNIQAKAENEAWEEIVTGMPMEERYEQKTGEKMLLCLKYAQKDILRIRKEMELPPGKPNILELVYRNLAIKKVETAVTDRGIQIIGEACICVIYRSQGEEAIQCYETSMPFDGMLESQAIDPQDICWIQAEPEIMELDVRDDYDGEQRVLGVELSFDVTVRVWSEEAFPVLEDVYALDCQLSLKKEPIGCESLLIQNQTKVRVAEQLELEKNQEKILQICCSSGELVIERTTKQEQGLFVEGILRVHLLYLTSDDFLPVAHAQGYVPVEQLVEIPPAAGEMRYELQSNIEQFQVNLLDSSSYEVKATISLEVIAFEKIEFDKIVDMEEQPLDLEMLQRQPGLIGHKVKPGEDLWNIAKVYHTTVERIQSTNHLEGEEIHPGQKLVVVKEITS